MLMAVVAANETADQPAAANDNARLITSSAELDLQLLMAARRGDSKQLKKLLRMEKDGGDESGMTMAKPEAQVVVEVDHPRPPPPPPPVTAAPSPPPVAPLLEDGVTMEGDSLLHVVAACGDDDEYLYCAKIIARNKKHKGGATAKRQVLEARNDNGDTPLHCAAAAGNANMISCLIHLGNTDEELLRIKNKCGETALHQAIRAPKNKVVCIDLLMDVDSELACIPHEEGTTSPLFLAISLGDVEIAQHLYGKSNGKLSYSGPDGRNVLHAAVSCGRGKSLPMVLKWLKEAKTAATADGDDMMRQLSSQRDNENGSTPLHLAASLGGLPSPIFLLPCQVRAAAAPLQATRLLLDANVSAAYQPDKRGRAYPIHAAASAGSLAVVKMLLRRCPDCAALRDAEGRTFLHVAADKEHEHVVRYVCRTPELASILNAQDKNGDTALHLSVRAGDLQVFDRLIKCPQVRLDVPNKEGMRPVDVSWRTMPLNAYYAWDPRIHIRTSLLMVGAPYGESRGDLFHDKRTSVSTPKFEGGVDKVSDNLTAAAQVLAIFSVLITTVTFASAFTLPGGYRSAGDGAVAGTPVLAGSYAFDAFILSDTLAFVCSFFATSLLLYAGVPAYSLDSRFSAINAAYSLMMNSGRSLVAAFALGLYVVLLPVARTIPVAIALMMTVLGIVLIKASEGINSLLLRPVTARSRQPSAWELVFGWIVFVLDHFWSFILIFGLPAIRKWLRAK